MDVTNPNYPGNTLVLKIKGYEHSFWVTHHTAEISYGGVRVKKNYTVEHGSSAAIYSNKVPIHTFGEM